MMAPSTNYELSEDMDHDQDAYAGNDSQYSVTDASDVEKGAAMNKMKKLAQKIYDTTPGIGDRKCGEMPACLVWTIHSNINAFIFVLMM